MIGGICILLINRGSGMVLPYSIRFVLDDVIGQGQTHSLLHLMPLLIAALAIQACTSHALTKLVADSGYRLVGVLRRHLQAHLHRLPLSFFDENTVGDLISRVMRDVDGVKNLFGHVGVELLGALITIAIALVLLARISAVLTAIVVGYVVGFALLVFLAIRFCSPLYRQRDDIHGQLSSRLAESIGGIRVIKGYRAESQEENKFAAGVIQLVGAVTRVSDATSIVSAIAVMLIGAVSVTVMWVGAYLVSMHALTVGEFVSYLILLGLLSSPIVQIVMLGSQISEAKAGLDRARAIWSVPKEQDARRVREVRELRGEVNFEGVSFAYKAGQWALLEASFCARPGSITALVGPSGAGKSTVAGLIAGFYTPSQGIVRVDGIDLREVKLDSYRAHLGFVLQETFLFDGTIRDNVAFARPDATDKAIFEACEVARVNEFAARLPDGYAAVIGERGVRLSGGQRQRISIARAVLANPRILILDEATSNVDSESELMIQKALSELMQGRTTIVIAHRLSTIRCAEQILVFEGGLLVEHGKHEALYGARGRYWQLYTAQQEQLFYSDSDQELGPSLNQPSTSSINETPFSDPATIISKIG